MVGEKGVPRLQTFLMCARSCVLACMCACGCCVLQELAGLRAEQAEEELQMLQERLREEQAGCDALKKQIGGWRQFSNCQCKALQALQLHLGRRVFPVHVQSGHVW